MTNTVLPDQHAAPKDDLQGHKLLQIAFRAINVIERVGNKLPHPVWLFIFLATALILLSAIMEALGVTVTNPGDGSEITVKSLLSREGFQVIVGDVVDNYASFPPLATILTTMC